MFVLLLLFVMLLCLVTQTPWARLPAVKTNTFTLIQLACLGSMM